MSLVEEVGAQVRAGTNELPVAAVTTALARLRAGLDLLRTARQQSDHDLGTGQLAVATEHLENAGRALIVAQEQLTGYLTAIGLTGNTPPGSVPEGGGRGDRPVRGSSSTPGGTGEKVPGDWWSARVAVLTGTPESDERSGPTEPDELLRLVTARVSLGDRTGLAAELGSVRAHVGLALAALAPDKVYEAVVRLLGRAPVAEDLPRLSGTARASVGALLPGLPDEAISAQLARACRAPVQASGTPIHPADSAVAGAVLAGVLQGAAGGLGAAGTSSGTGTAGQESRAES